MDNMTGIWHMVDMFKIKQLKYISALHIALFNSNAGGLENPYNFIIMQTTQSDKGRL